jgi:hypothetical protein
MKGNHQLDNDKEIFDLLQSELESGKKVTSPKLLHQGYYVVNFELTSSNSAFAELSKNIKEEILF